jgi:predicted DNA-binding transcriptional regulator YafY
VSLATARRDLEALSTAGVPVYAQPCRGGGWTLLGGARTDLSGLTAAPEAQALFLLAGPTSATTPTLRSALRELVRALPSPMRAEAESAADAVVLDPAGWGELGPDRSDLVEDLQKAVVGRRRVRLVYRSHGRARTPMRCAASSPGSAPSWSSATARAELVGARGCRTGSDSPCLD